MANNNEMSITYDYNNKSTKSTSANITDTLNAVTSGIAVMQQMGEWITVAQTALDKYNAALVTTGTASTNGAAASTQLMNVLTPLQTVYGALSGQITMAEAAQQLLNSAIRKKADYEIALKRARWGTYVTGASPVSLCTWVTRHVRPHIRAVKAKIVSPSFRPAGAFAA